MADRSDKNSKNYKLSISNPKIFDAVKMLISVLIALAITFVILCLVSKDPINAMVTILTGPLTKTRYIGAVIESFIPYAFAGLAAGVLCWLEWPFDNASKPKQSYHFNSLTRGWQQVIFEHTGNKLYMLRFHHGKLEKKESLYAHFQHRGFMKDRVTDYSHFLVTPRAIIDYPRHFVTLRLRWLCRNRTLVTKYYQWKDRILWKFGIKG